MPYKALLATAALMAGVSGTTWFLSADNKGQFDWFVPAGPSPQQPVSGMISDPRAPGSNDDEETPSEPSDDALGFMLASVADEYQQSIRYPDYSVPLSAAQAQAYQGNLYHPVELPLGDNGNFVVTLDKFRFTQGEPILVVASLSGRQVFGDSLSATLETATERDQTDSAQLDATEDTGYYQGSLSSDHEPGEYRLIVEARVDGQPVRHVSSLSIEPDLGDFSGIDSPYLSGNDLVIPVKFDPENAGYYALTAQLYNGQQAIAQLSAEASLSGSSGTLQLRAHGSVLANRNIEGQLQLRHLQIRQMPAGPGDRTYYAFGPEEGYEFSPPSLDRLRDEPAVNPESEQRAVLLRRLADKF
ncbi:hypothetical protein [Marinobacter halophilus]|uniref:Uncharacterized protein n=1 Tax=Marinobacter halophilus TaxID=1323740 RepID=A0A2T1K9R8_9GAMM|nr:hypothetical protein [Marinobacter halophilus]PSF06513.1 hypothetical protein C7H08_15535 [Marinobacter halophilus]GGC73274.1 hypothetical protein GCM10011362_22220 [Marinobacter halophilus]